MEQSDSLAVKIVRRFNLVVLSLILPPKSKQLQQRDVFRYNIGPLGVVPPADEIKELVDTHQATVCMMRPAGGCVRAAHDTDLI
jgi:hypothetical protein